MSDIKLRLKLKDIKPNPNHSGIFDKDQLGKLMASIRTVGIMRSFAVFKIKNNYHLVCGHHLHQAALMTLGKDYVVSCELNEYDDDTADWGMVVENFTQKIGHKKIALELKGLQARLRKRFKTWQKFEEYANKHNIPLEHKDWKSTAGENHTSSEIKYRDGTRKKGEQHYPTVGSSRHINIWLNRQGTIMPDVDIREHLEVVENLSKELFEKIVEGESNRKIKCPNEKCKHKNYPNDKKCSECGTKLPEHKDASFNWTKALILARATKDNTDEKDKEEEQKDLLNALNNSNNEHVRRHRVRSQSKIIAKYKDLKKLANSTDPEIPEKAKKESKIMVEAIRQGEKDISLIDLPYTKLPKALTETQVFDYTSELMKAFKNTENKLEEWMEKALEKATKKEIEEVITFLTAWSKEALAPQIKYLVKSYAMLVNQKEMKGGYR